MTLPKSFGLRNRSAMGITEVTDAVSVVVSEETGGISVFDHGKFTSVKNSDELREILKAIFWILILILLSENGDKKNGDKKDECIS